MCTENILKSQTLIKKKVSLKNSQIKFEAYN